MKINVFRRSAAEVREDCRKCAEEIAKSFTPDIIIFIAKSGFLMAKQCPNISAVKWLTLQ